MFLNFFNELREAKVPVTLKEYLMLMEAMDEKVIDMNVEDFYYLSRAALVKDERNIDKFDKVFSHVFKGLDSLADAVDVQDLPPLPRLPEPSWPQRIGATFAMVGRGIPHIGRRRRPQTMRQAD